MSTIAKWRKKKWLISQDEIKEFKSLQFSYAQQAKNNNSTEGKGLTNEKGLDLFKMSFSTTLIAGIGVDIRKEIDSWKQEVTKSGTFYLNGKQLGPKKQRLDKVSVNNIRVDNSGRMLQATLQFSFVEDDPEKEAALSESATEVKASKTDKEELHTSKTEGLATEGIKTGSYVNSTSKVDLDGNPINTDDTMKVVSTKGGVTTLSGPNGTVSIPHNCVSLAVD
jgi:hypothetical protein